MLSPLAQNLWSPRHAAHLLNRAGYGALPQERDALFELGRDQGAAAAVDSLLGASETWSSIPLPAWIFDEADPNGDLWANQADRYRAFDYWYVERLTRGQPLAGKILKFLVDHMPVEAATSPQYQRSMYFFRYYDMLSKHAAGDVAGDGRYGNFKTVVTDVSWSEAMIRMLDLYQSTAANINENFGRELLELFTLGVDGGYTEEDVGAAAEAFTGRRLYNYQSPHPNAPTVNPNSFAPPGQPVAGPYQNNNQQDKSNKTFIGQTKTPGGGNIVDGDDIIAVAFANIACARHLAWKFWRYFASPEPSGELLDALSLKLRDTHDYEIRPFLRDIFLSEEFYADAVIGSQIKDAGDLVGSLTRQLGLPTPAERANEFIHAQLGYNPNFPPNIAGWPEPDGEGNSWLAAGTMVFRMNMPSIFTHRNYALFNNGAATNQMASYPEADWDAIAPPDLRPPANFPLLIQALNERFLPTTALRKSQIRLLQDRYLQIAQKVGELEAVKETVRLIMALPEYQLQ